jgi:carbonic anhydrase
VVRVAGNILGASEFDSLLFAIKNFSSSVVLILGHKGCGAVNAVNAVVNGRGSDLQAIGKMIEPAVAQAKKESKNNVLDRAIELNVEHMVDQLKAVPFIKAAVGQQKLQVVGGVYDLETGKVNLLK